MPYMNIDEREKNRIRARAYHAEHREQQNAAARKYYADHRDERRQNAKVYYAEHKEELSQYSRQYRAKHRDTLLRKAATRRTENRDHINAKARKDHAENKEQRNATIRKYRANLRSRFFAIYGDECADCHLKVKDLLTVGHTNNDGAQDRLENGGVWGVLFRAIAQPNPDKYKTQCWNCNHIARLNHSIAKRPFNNSQIADKIMTYNQQYRESLRSQYFAIYGAECTLCGATDQRILTVSHRNNDGGRDRRENGGMLGVLLRAIKQPDHTRYHTLCCNCNSGGFAQERRMAHKTDGRDDTNALMVAPVQQYEQHTRGH